MSASLISQREKQPVLVLTCQKDSHPFQDRTIILNDFVKVGRSVARAKPSSTNSIFDCKVLSRSHALIWYKAGRFWLRDTNSSNGTFVNSTRIVKKNDEECADREIFSGDIIRFGVDVVEHDTTHGCIIAQVALYHPNGLEAKPSVELIFDNGICGVEAFHTEQMFCLTHYIGEAMFREQLLDDKLESVRKLLQETQEVSKNGWQAMLNEGQLLEKLNLYECQLSLLKQDLPENSLHSQIAQVLEEKYNLEKASKIMLERLLNEKTAVLSRATELEHTFMDSQRECARLRQDFETTQKAYQEVMSDRQDKLVMLEQLQKQLKDNELNKSIANDYIKQQSPDTNALHTSKLDHKCGQSMSEDALGLVNGLDNGVSLNSEHRADASKPRIDDRYNDVDLPDLSEFDQLCNEAVMNANDSPSVTSRVDDNMPLFNQSVELLKFMKSNLSKLLYVFENNQSEFKKSDSYSPNCSHVSDDADRLSNTVVLNKFKDRNFVHLLGRVNKLICYLANHQTQIEVNSSVISDELIVKDEDRLVCSTGSDFSIPSTEHFNSLNEVITTKDEFGTISRDSTENPTPFAENNENDLSTIGMDSLSADENELTRLKNDLREALSEIETYKSLNRSLGQQDVMKAELLLSLREECDTLKQRIELIEVDLVTSRNDHQRLASEVRKVRKEAEELQQERDILSTQLLEAKQRLESCKSALATTLLGESKRDNFQTTNNPNINHQYSLHESSTESILLSSSNEQSRMSSLTEHSFSLFAVIPVMIVLCAFMVYIFLKFAR